MITLDEVVSFTLTKNGQLLYDLSELELNTDRLKELFVYCINLYGQMYPRIEHREVNVPYTGKKLDEDTDAIPTIKASSFNNLYNALASATGYTTRYSSLDEFLSIDSERNRYLYLTEGTHFITALKGYSLTYFKRFEDNAPVTIFRGMRDVIVPLKDKTIPGTIQLQLSIANPVTGVFYNSIEENNSFNFYAGRGEVSENRDRLYLVLSDEFKEKLKKQDLKIYTAYVLQNPAVDLNPRRDILFYDLFEAHLLNAIGSVKSNFVNNELDVNLNNDDILRVAQEKLQRIEEQKNDRQMWWAYAVR